ncbi:hypothetical protein [Rhodococcus qingshengii]|uniref:hypothetical protein n=1 Tax=Rhodococcus qingshengii TaxID=334542 RepID=UPI0022B46B2E|nr:hypothetical protein [Rhodococcus qingshengii]MCZ4618736.1 hypothetical protein [Rhodococcus qingshengii]
MNPEHLYAVGMLQYPALQRLKTRSARGNELSAWSLNPARPDKGSVMESDDDRDFAEATPHGVAGAALFPLMNAIDALVVVHETLERVSTKVPFNHHPASVMSLCRTSFESAAQSIWMLSPPDRDKRRRRAAGASMVGAGQKSSHLRVELKAHDDGKIAIEEPFLSSMRDHLEFATEERDKLTATNKETDSFSTMVSAAATWMETNPPRHLLPELTANTLNLRTRIDQQYRLCSSFTHGYNWGTDFCRSVGDVAAMLSDAVTVAVFVTETGVALFEAHATDSASPGTRPKRYPARLQTSVDQMSELYAPV